jgi:ribose transport system permease protein
MAQGTLKRSRRLTLRTPREANVLIAFLLLCLFFYWQQPETFLKEANLAIIMRFVATFGVLAIGEVLVIITGGIDLSVGSLTALTGVLVAHLTLKGITIAPAETVTLRGLLLVLLAIYLVFWYRVGWRRAGLWGNLLAIVLPVVLVGTLLWGQTNGLSIPQLPWLLSILAVLVIAGAVGAWHGLFVTQLGIPAFIITLGTWLIARGLAAFITRGYPIVYDSDHPFLILGQRSVDVGPISFPIAFLVLVIVALIISFVLNQTVLGRHIYATGGNREAARVSGVHVNRVRVFAYVASAMLAAVTGMILASRLGQGTPTVGTAYELWAIAACVIGGTSLFGGEGTVLGAVLGAAIMGVMQNGMVLLNVSSYLQDVILGMVLVIAVTYDTVRRMRSRRG